MQAYGLKGTHDNRNCCPGHSKAHWVGEGNRHARPHGRDHYRKVRERSKARKMIQEYEFD